MAYKTISLSLIVGLCSMLLAWTLGAAENTETDWKTYRSENFGYEISFPAGMEFKAYFDGRCAIISSKGYAPFNISGGSEG
ncbi:MAG: hypothetical protein NT140_11850 [Deltaproteobacteria bacterium]|nr:hypothetical protein [Deltaproteobacteria bacterium]